jgi:hypothetical protein
MPLRRAGTSLSQFNNAKPRQRCRGFFALQDWRKFSLVIIARLTRALEEARLALEFACAAQR